MKSVSSFFTLLLLSVLSFGLQAQNFNIDTQASNIKWTGSKVVGGGHYGSVKLGSGQLVVENGQLKDGAFTADMNTITVEDLSGAMAEKLSGHLFSEDFFAVQKHKNSTFTVSTITALGQNKYNVTGDLTIKGKTETISFPATLRWENEQPIAEATVKVDRSKFDIRYGSPSFFNDLGDKAISDEFQLDIKLVGKR